MLDIIGYIFAAICGIVFVFGLLGWIYSWIYEKLSEQDEKLFMAIINAIEHIFLTAIGVVLGLLIFRGCF